MLGSLLSVVVARPPPGLNCALVTAPLPLNNGMQPDSQDPHACVAVHGVLRLVLKQLLAMQLHLPQPVPKQMYKLPSLFSPLPRLLYKLLLLNLPLQTQLYKLPVLPLHLR